MLRTGQVTPLIGIKIGKEKVEIYGYAGRDLGIYSGALGGEYLKGVPYT